MVSVRQIREAYRKASRDTVKDLANIVIERGSEVIQNEAMDRGDLLSSDEIELDKEEPKGVVRWTSEHAKYVHFGTRPHWPPLAPILAWVKRNLARFTTTTGEIRDAIRPSAKLAPNPRKSPTKVALRVARGIQAKIAREGTSPVPFASRGAAEARQRANTILKRNVDERLKKI